MVYAAEVFRDLVLLRSGSNGIFWAHDMNVLRLLAAAILDLSYVHIYIYVYIYISIDTHVVMQYNSLGPLRVHARLSFWISGKDETLQEDGLGMCVWGSAPKPQS